MMMDWLLGLDPQLIGDLSVAGVLVLIIGAAFRYVVMALVSLVNRQGQQHAADAARDDQIASERMRVEREVLVIGREFLVQSRSFTKVMSEHAAILRDLRAESVQVRGILTQMAQSLRVLTVAISKLERDLDRLRRENEAAT
jgi:hypothetical protein